MDLRVVATIVMKVAEYSVYAEKYSANNPKRTITEKFSKDRNSKKLQFASNIQ